MKKRLYSLSFLTFLGIIFVATSVFAWTSPTVDPPGGNLPAPLNVSSTNQSKEGYLAIGTSTAPTVPLMVIGTSTFSGNVGIGTTGPQTKLDIGSTLQIRNDGTETSFYTNKNYPRLYNSSSGGTYPFDRNGNLVIQPRTSADSDIAFAVGATTPSVAMMIDGTNGNVGIGTTAPGAKLDVQGQIIGGFGAQTTGGTLDWNDVSNTRSGSGYTLLLGSAANGPGPGTYFHPFNFEYNSKNGSGNITQFAIPYGYSSGIDQGIYMRGRYSDTWSNWVKVISENTSGNVGIGTTAPSQKLDVTGGNIEIGTAGNGIYFTGNVGATDARLYTLATNDRLLVRAESTDDVAQFASYGLYLPQDTTYGLYVTGGAQFNYADTGDQVVIQNGTGNVGIGTTAPDARLDVWKPSSGDILNVSSSTAGDLLTIDNSGLIGIGTSTPSEMLTVNGNIDVLSHKITNLATPTADADAATKAYVDAASGGGVLITYGHYCGYYAPTAGANAPACPTGWTEVYTGYSNVYMNGCANDAGDHDAGTGVAGTDAGPYTYDATYSDHSYAPGNCTGNGNYNHGAITCRVCVK